jgi:uncharacterized protein
VNVDPLSEAELKALEAHLSATEGAMSLAGARGYMTAAASAPTLAQPSDWMPIVVGGGGFADVKAANRIFGLVFRLYNGIISTLDARGRVAPGPETSNEEVTAWCAGYLRLAQSDPRWTADPTGVELIIPVASLATGSDLDQPDDGTPDPPMSAEQFARYRSGLDDCVRAIDLYWGARRPPPRVAPVVRAASKVGRNELCPCGSGKKYKRCHGTVH